MIKHTKKVQRYKAAYSVIQMKRNFVVVINLPKNNNSYCQNSCCSCQDEDFHPVGYSSSETMSSDEEEEVEEVPAVTRRGRPHGYIADGFVVVEDSEVGEFLF